MRILFITILFVFTSLIGKAQMNMHRAVVADSLNVFDKKVPAMFYDKAKYQTKVIKPLPPDIYTQNFGFFCKQELKMHQAHVPLSFRLGSMEYCNMLEGK